MNMGFTPISDLGEHSVLTAKLLLAAITRITDNLVRKNILGSKKEYVTVNKEEELVTFINEAFESLNSRNISKLQ